MRIVQLHPFERQSCTGLDATQGTRFGELAVSIGTGMQVLEVEVALANGTLALVNAQSHPHLFRALQVHRPAMLLSLPPAVG